MMSKSTFQLLENSTFRKVDSKVKNKKYINQEKIKII